MSLIYRMDLQRGARDMVLMVVTCEARTTFVDPGKVEVKGLLSLKYKEKREDQ